MTELGLRTIPGYTVYEALESDLVSVTYLAERQADGYPVFLHVVSEEFDDAGSAAVFFDAHQRVSEIGHPVLPTVWDVGQASGVLYSVTSAVESRPLAATLAAVGRIDATEALAICGELADTLDIMHAADVVHGAINPHTVWINDRARAPSAPRVTLRGFGISPLLARSVSAGHADPPPDDLLYIAPEQLRQDEVTGRADQYALACMTVHCLSGSPPFERATINALLGAHLFAALPPATALWQALPAHVGDAIRQALAKDPAERFSLCCAFAAAIGVDKRRSWTWMVAEALGVGDDEGLEAVRLRDDWHDTGGRRQGGVLRAVDDGQEDTRQWPVDENDLEAHRGRWPVGEDHAAADDDAGAGDIWPDDDRAGTAGRLPPGVGDAAQELTVAEGDLSIATGTQTNDSHTSSRGTDDPAVPRRRWTDAPRDDQRPALQPNGPSADTPSHSDWPPLSDRPPQSGEPPRRPGRRQPDHDVTVASLADADWLPGNSGGPGTAGHRTSRDRGPAAARSWSTAADRARDRQVLRWLAVAIVTLLMVATIVVLALRTPSDAPDQPAAAPQQQSQRAPPEPEATAAWSQAVSPTRITSLLATSDALLSGSQTGITALAPATGDEQWQTALDETLTEVTTVDDTVVARSASALHAFERRTGRPLWDTVSDASTPTAMAVGDHTVYEVNPYGGKVRMRALALATGDETWTLDDLEAAGGGTWAVYDPSERGDQMLYVLTGSRLHAIDTAAQAVRWRTDLDGPQPASLTAAAGAVLVIDEAGRICRYSMRDGDEGWSQCATLRNAPGLDAALRTRNGRVIVRSASEVAGVDFTSGTAQWRVTDETGFQRPFAANTTTVYVAHDDGRVEAIDHERGVERWTSEAFGEITAMTADDDAAYVATADGSITRLQPTGADSSTS